eukprot:TRINITY_DN1022_c0_g1_i5.p1 TRINITY_DN1022_c0_g1~~TRINITY_DN1022_c0_g1_i5.p1  ORF type:complete len:469 (-),score=69.68 TRINITY_DN1022_c0_g1_i5:74-1480(-)
MLSASFVVLFAVTSAEGAATVDAKGHVLLAVRTSLHRGELSMQTSFSREEPVTGPVGQREWEAFAGHYNRACRGSRATDNKDSYYEIYRNITSVEDCKALCLANQPRCKGMEYSLGRCEIWTREEGIAAWWEPSLEDIDVANQGVFTCERYGWPARYLQPVNGGVGQACRGETSNDKAASYFVNSTVRNLEDCRALCVAADVCRGLSFFINGNWARCEIWKRAIKATTPQSDVTCLRFEPPAASAPALAESQVMLSSRISSGREDPVTGPVGQREWEAFAGHYNRACRGSRATDNKDSYYEIYRNITSVEDCKALCLANQPRCKGMEYSLGRCEIWTREEGIAAWWEPSLEDIDAANQGVFTCERYGWPARYLQPVNGGVGQACRGETSNDKAASYFVNSTVRNLEDCRALCVAADVCRGLSFFINGNWARCEIWTRAIKATTPQSDVTCLRFEPPAAVAPAFVEASN